MKSREIMITRGDVQICTQVFGYKEHPALLLIMGAQASMTWWDEEFCTRLSKEGFFVIRYDHRDTGRSTSYEPGTINYDVMDMAEDAIAVLDYYGIKEAHIAGMSLGGMLAQILALKYPARVLSAALISSSVWDNAELPPIDERILNYHKKAAKVNWDNEEEIIKYWAGGWQMLNGSRHPFDKRRALELAETEAARAVNPRSPANHALLQGGEEYMGRLKEIDIPVLIVHGTEDPVLPYEHADALEKALPDPVMLTLNGAGHEIHKNDWDLVIEAIILNIGKAAV